jgi:hypothetical protein
MKLNLNEISVTSIVGLAISGLALLFALKERKKIDIVCENLDCSVKDLCKKDINIDISEEVVNMVVQERTNNEVAKFMPKAVESGRKEATALFKDAVQREINSQYADIKSEVRRSVQEKVGHIDISGVKRQVIEDAKEEAAERFHDELDGVLEKFNDELSSVKKIYASIAQKISE